MFITVVVSSKACLFFILLTLICMILLIRTPLNSGHHSQRVKIREIQKHLSHNVCRIAKVASKSYVQLLVSYGSCWEM